MSTAKAGSAESASNKPVEYNAPNGMCRVCLCTEHDACYIPGKGTCGWAEPNLCSHCKDYPGQALNVANLTAERLRYFNEKYDLKLKHQTN